MGGSATGGQPSGAGAGGASGGAGATGGGSGGATVNMSSGGATGGSSSSSSGLISSETEATTTMLLPGIIGTASTMEVDISRPPRVDESFIQPADVMSGTLNDLPTDLKTVALLRARQSIKRRVGLAFKHLH